MMLLAVIYAMVSLIVALAAMCVVLAAVCAVLLWAIRWLLPRPVLIAIPYSHYVELARWALQSRDTAFEEVKVPIGPHVVVIALYRLLFRGELQSATSFPGSQDATLSEDGGLLSAVQRHLRRLSGSPAFITAEGACLPDSWSIVELCGWEIDAATQASFDTELGPAVRLFFYHHIFADAPSLYREMQSCSRPSLIAFDACERCFKITREMRSLMDLTPEGAEVAARTIARHFEEASLVLAGDPYLGNGGGGESFGGADMAFAAITGWLLLPRAYTNGVVVLPEEWAMPPAVQRLKAELRETAAAKHVMRCYEQHRVRVAN